MTDQTDQKVSSLELLIQGRMEPELEDQAPMRAGAPCPRCGEGTLAYNGLLLLACPSCGYTGGGGGCT